MPESRWESLCRQHSITVDHCEHAILITELTCAIGNGIRQLLQQLNDRAVSLTACVQYDLALQDAAIMREMAPRSCLGYLRACNVYSSQGRQWAVIDMCNQGLAAVAHDDPGYHQLQAIMDDAKEITSRRVDFLSKLPLDIVACNLTPRIMDSIMPFNSNKRSPLFYVSRAWHQRILQVTDGLTFYAKTSNIETLTEGHHHLLRFSPFVTRLDVHGKVNGLASFCARQGGPSLCDLFTRGNFTKLTTLNIQGMYVKMGVKGYGNSITQPTPYSGWWIKDSFSYKTKKCIGNVGQSTQTPLHHQEQGLFNIAWMQRQSQRHCQLL